ncbi:flavin-containing monooxygenase [Marinobacter piscensis]|uniref:flavin-containing monooxygenase n=1 Tax=Marinobacter piscensis TaxID=1562308 RepID=UPI00248326AC|nr:NAD(P)/FAD-dependent oxidoreductase [Marinobacter piscensis]
MSNKDNKTLSSPLIDVVIIGAGFGGLGMAIQLKKAGIGSFIILEKAGSIGGTWRDNTYPGAACDVQSHLYSYSFEPKSDWSRKFGAQPEIHAYIERCAHKYRLHEHIRFKEEVASAAFNEADAQWTVKTKNGTTVYTRALVTATGQLNQPAYPRFAGMERFKGKVFHSARWDHDYDLTGDKVAVVGTGASAIQFVPRIVSSVKELKLFQRSGAWVIPKPDRPFTRLEKRVFEAIPLADRLYRALIYWKNESRALAFTRFSFILNIFKWQAQWIARRTIQDPEKRQNIIPDYPIGCKRILISNDWYEAINRDNLDLITNDIDHIEPDAIITKDGTRYDVDTIIYATGFKATDFLAPMNITGLNGRELNQVWAEGAEAYKGVCVNGFPNLFILYGPNTNLAHNSILFMLESQFRYVVQGIQAVLGSERRYLHVKAERQDDFSVRIQEKLKGSVWDAGCSSWYKTASGKNTNNWPGFTFSYRKATANLDLQDFEVESG